MMLSLRNKASLRQMHSVGLVVAAAEGHPSAVMDMSFANQVLSIVYLEKQRRTLEPCVYPVPTAIDQEVARLKLATMDLTIDQLTSYPEKYIVWWQEGSA